MVVLIYKFVIQTPVKTKRWIIDAPTPATRSLPVADLEKRIVVPGLEWTPEDTLAPKRRYVVHGADWKPKDLSERRVIPPGSILKAGSPVKRIVLPGVEWKGEDSAKRFVVPGKEWKPENSGDAKRAKSFKA